jgi:hypothetical protein
VVVDMPFGIRCGNVKHWRRMYRPFVSELARVMRPPPPPPQPPRLPDPDLPTNTTAASSDVESHCPAEGSTEQQRQQMRQQQIVEQPMDWEAWQAFGAGKAVLMTALRRVLRQVRVDLAHTPGSGCGVCGCGGGGGGGSRRAGAGRAGPGAVGVRVRQCVCLSMRCGGGPLSLHLCDAAFSA